MKNSISSFFSKTERSSDAGAPKAKGLKYNMNKFVAIQGVGCLIDPSIVIQFPICCKTFWRVCRQLPQIRNAIMLQKLPQKENHSERRQTASKRLKQNMQLTDQIWLLLFFARCWSECFSRRMSRRLLEDAWRPWISILLCPYVTFVIIYVIIISHSYVASMRGQKNAKFAVDMRVFFLSLWVFFLRPFLWGILAFRITSRYSFIIAYVAILMAREGIFQTLWLPLKKKISYAYIHGNGQSYASLTKSFVSVGQKLTCMSQIVLISSRKHRNKLSF